MGKYQDLIFYQKARQAVKLTDTLIKYWPKTMQAQEISRQLFRSATSIGANIAEGHGRHQGVEYIHFLMIAQGSANETEHWLNTAKDCGLGPNEIIKMIAAAIGSIRSKQGTRNLKEESSDYLTGASPLHDK